MKIKWLKIVEKLKQRKPQIFTYIILPFLLFLIIDILGHKSVFEGIAHYFSNPLVVLANASIIMFSLSLSLLTRRRVFVVALISTLWLVLGFVNFFLLINRVTPFTAMDFLNIDSALGVIDKYFNTFTYGLLFVVIGLVVTMLIFAFMKAPRVNGVFHIWKSAVGVFVFACIMFGSISLGLFTGALSLKFPELSQSYKKYGFVYCFSNSVFNSGVVKPDNYSEDELGKYQEEETSKNNNPQTQVNAKDIKTPNIIIVQLESFFDITRCKDMEFSEDPLPNLHRYMKSCASGLLSMPVVGAGTVNSEFEILTGLSIDNFGPGEYPYKTMLKDRTCESICYNLSDLGYTSHAIHNNTGHFYGRNVVFSNLGFQDFTSVEYMNLNQETDYTPMGWAKDKVLTKYIDKALDSTKGSDFVYAISVQGHGSYPSDGEYDFPIKVTAKEGSNIDEEILKSREYYTNQIHEMDQFIGELIREIKARNEESIVVFYGDHLPSLSFSDEEFLIGDTYSTEYFIWENMDDISYSSEDMQAFEMESKLLKPLKITNGVVNKYHQDNYKKEKDKNAIPEDQKDEEDYLHGLALLQYDILSGEYASYNGTNPFKKTDIQMGIDTIKITNVYKQTKENAPVETAKAEEETVKGDVDNVDVKKDEDETNPPLEQDGYVIIKGKNFTKYSKVYVNDEYFGNTEFIDQNTLRIYYPDLQGLDSFVVAQTHSADNPLSMTKEMLYYGKGFDKIEK